MAKNTYSEYPPTLTEASIAYAEFLKTQNLPGQIIWVRPSQILIWRRTCYVKNPGKNSSEVNDLYKNNYKRFGARVDGLGCLANQVVAQITIPLDDLTAQYRQVGTSHLGYSMLVEPIRCKAVHSDFFWRILQMLGARHWEEEPNNVLI